MQNPLVLFLMEFKRNWTAKTSPLFFWNVQQFNKDSASQNGNSGPQTTLSILEEDKYIYTNKLKSYVFSAVFCILCAVFWIYKL